MLTKFIDHIRRMFQRAGKPQSYGSELERFIVSKNPQSIYDIEQLTRQFDTQLSQGKLQ